MEEAVGLAPTRLASLPRRHDSNVRPPPSGAVLSSTELRRDQASTAGLEPALTGFVDRGPLQLDDVDMVLLRATDRI